MARQEYDWQLPKELVNRLGTESYGAQRAIHEKDHLLLVLHEPPLKEGHQRDHAVFLRKPDGKWLYHGSTPGESAFARLFTEIVGMAPLSYLNEWRMALARERLRDSDARLAAISASLGYASEFSFAAAFKRHHGVAPGRWRIQARDVGGVRAVTGDQQGARRKVGQQGSA